MHQSASPLHWNRMPQQSSKGQNALPLTMNKKFIAIMAERDAAIHERDLALSEKKAALAERDLAILQRDSAISERDSARMERDNAIFALQYQNNSNLGVQLGSKRMQTHSIYESRETPLTDAFPISVIASRALKSESTKRTKLKKGISAKKRKKVGEDLNRKLVPNGLKTKNEWNHDLGLNQIAYDESTMPPPVCSCTGLYRQCYKWGNGGWQSSCCTTTLSEYPLPPMPHKRHARMSGRKMSRNVFARLLSRLASSGHDLSVPLDLKDYWARHGTNRYITIR